jgi:hypothetical protein
MVKHRGGPWRLNRPEFNHDVAQHEGNRVAHDHGNQLAQYSGNWVAQYGGNSTVSDPTPLFAETKQAA